MRLYTLAALLVLVFITLCLLDEAEGWGSRRGGRRGSSRSSSSRSVSRSSRRGGSRSSSRSVSRSSRRGGGGWGGRRSSSRSSGGSRRTSASSRGRVSSRRTSSRRTSNSRRGGYSVNKSPRGKTVTIGKTKVHVGNTGIRGRDKTGHRTGLGTLARETIKNPKKTFKAVKEFVKSYNQMRKKNLKGGNLAAHRQANKKATQKSSSKVASAISALREQYKNFRVKKNPDGSWHIGDTRTKKERDATMNANKQGRQDAKKGGN